MHSRGFTGFFVIWQMCLCGFIFAQEKAVEWDIPRKLEAIDLEEEKEYLGLDEELDADPDGAKDFAEGQKLLRKLASTEANQADLMAASTWLTIESYTASKMPEVKNKGASFEECRYEIVLDMLLKLHGKSPRSGALVRLEHRKNAEDVIRNNPNHSRESYWSTLASDKQRLQEIKYLSKRGNRAHNPIIKIAYSLASDRGKAEAYDYLLEIAKSGKDQHYTGACLLLQEYHGSKHVLIAVIEERLANPFKEGAWAYRYFLEMIRDAEWLNTGERVALMGKLCNVDRFDGSYSVSIWIEMIEALNDVEKFSTEILTNPHGVQILDLVDMDERKLLNAVLDENYSDSVIIGVGMHRLKSSNDASALMKTMLKRKWEPKSAGHLYTVLMLATREDSTVASLLFANLSGVMSHDVEEREHLLYEMAKHDYKLSIKHAMLLDEILRRHQSKGNARHFETKAAIILLAKSDTQIGRNLLSDLLDDSHEIHASVKESKKERMQIAALCNLQHIGDEVVEHRELLTRYLSEGHGHEVGYAALALRAWPDDQKPDEAMTRAIKKVMRQSGDGVFDTFDPGRFINTRDPDVISTAKIELLNFIRAGGRDRIREFKEEVALISKDEVNNHRIVNKDPRTIAQEILEAME